MYRIRRRQAYTPSGVLKKGHHTYELSYTGDRDTPPPPPPPQCQTPDTPLSEWLSLTQHRVGLYATPSRGGGGAVDIVGEMRLYTDRTRNLVWPGGQGRVQNEEPNFKIKSSNHSKRMSISNCDALLFWQSRQCSSACIVQFFCFVLFCLDFSQNVNN